ncbi:hypothetical protein [Sphingomonas sp.]|uniref:hypothetical protein n=1 Tax=Sphingomonas sp. TaxID=28214 RepID=UPI0035BC09FA
MTTGSAVNTDTRMIAAGLAANVAVTRPFIITATGRAAPSRHAIVPAGAWAPLALMPHVDYLDNPEHRPGSGFVGGRISSIVPSLAPGAIPAQANVAVTLRPLPDSADAILRDLRSRAGLWSAPGALFARAAWTDSFVATFLDRLRENGDDARLTIAHAQASLAVRKMWLAVEWDVGVDPNASLTTAGGAAVVGRALIDAIALVDRLAAPERENLARPAHREIALAALLTALGHFIRHVRAAESVKRISVARRKLKRATDWARTILDAVGVFSVVGDAERKRWERLTAMVDVGELHDHAGGTAAKLDCLARQLEQLTCADLGNKLERTCWRPHIRRSLLRLAQPDRSIRLVLLARIRCDLIFTLATTRRLDRLYQMFPWLAAPHGAFPGCAGGALGALASLYEASRGVEIGLDMKRRLGDVRQTPGTVMRMTIHQAQAVYTSPRRVLLAAGRNYAAGAALVAQVTSHVMVKAALEEQSFGSLSLEATRYGHLGYNDAAALKDGRTRDAVVKIQQAQPAFQVTTRDDDLIRHMGLTLVRHFGAVAHSIWPTSYQRSDFTIHRTIVHSGCKPRKGKDRRAGTDGPWDRFSKHRIHQELVRSMLRTVDGGDDETLRDTIENIETPHADDGEYARAARLRGDASRKAGAWEEHDEGQAAARRAAEEPTNTADRGAILRDLVDDARRWRERDPARPQVAPQDDLLEDILLGRANLAQLAPVSDLFIPILWFAPLIDRDRLAWIAQGMPGQQARDNAARRAAQELALGGTWLGLGAVRHADRARPGRRHRLPPVHGRVVCHRGPRPCSVTRPLCRPEPARFARPPVRADNPTTDRTAEASNMYVICDEMWNSVDVYGPQSEIDRFKRRFIVPAPAGNRSRSTLAFKLEDLSGEFAWNFRDLGPHEHGMYSFAFDTLANFPTYALERLIRMFPRLYFDCECIADDDHRMGYGWFNTPPGGQDFRDDYDVPKGYWTNGGGKRTPPELRRHMMVTDALRQRLRDEELGRRGGDLRDAGDESGRFDR